MSEKNVTFYVNGPARLLMSSVIADEHFSGYRKYLILLNQFGYEYGTLLKHVRDRFEDVFSLKLPDRKYTHWGQWRDVYLRDFPDLRAFVRPDSRLVLFGIRSPVQKFLINLTKAAGNSVDVYAESVSVDRYFVERKSDGLIRGGIRKAFPRAFEFQHDYDRFFVLDPEMYRASPHFAKLRSIKGIYESNSFNKYARMLTSDIDLSDACKFDLVFLGQPLSNFDNFMSQAEEISILKSILGDRPVLILPHPNENFKRSNKYDCLPNARTLRAGIPSELILLSMMPKKTITYSSTCALNYAMMNPLSSNQFYPVFLDHYKMLVRYEAALPNIDVSDRFAVRESPYV